MKNRKILFLIFILLLLVTVPYLFAYINSGDNFVFGGFLLNPLDGNSYLAKMYLGWEGTWKFTLPYTAEPGEGAYLFLFYIFLGHFAKAIGILPVPIYFHAIRVLCAIFFWYTFYQFLQKVFHGHENLIWKSFLLCTIGSGLGWTLFLFGKVTSDLWVAEAYPFLSSFANPHFPLGLSLFLWEIILYQQATKWHDFVLLGLVGLLLSIIQPFGIVLLSLILLINTVIVFWGEIRLKLYALLSALIPGGLFLIYQYFAVLTNPQLAIWNQQNLTMSPPVWDFFISFSPVLFVALIGIAAIHKNQDANPYRRVILIWFIIAIILFYFPFNLQRRFILGFYIPAGVLAIYGIEYIKNTHTKFGNLLWKIVLILSIPTNIMVLLIGIFGIVMKDSHYYIERDEMTALHWIAENTPDHALVMASPDTGLYIPAYTGRSVLYGHPFETINEETQKNMTINFYRAEYNQEEKMSLLRNQSVDYVFCGPREKLIGNCDFLSMEDIVFKNQDVLIYQVNR